MLRVTLRSLLARKLRLLLSGFAIVLGVAFASGTFVLTDTLGKVFDTLFQDVTKNTSVTVQGISSLGGGAQSDREPVPQSVLDAVRRVPGVKEATGGVSGYAQVVDSHGKAYSTGGAPTFGISYDPGSIQEVLVLKQGRAPVGPSEVALDATTVDKAHLRLGDRITVLLKGPARKVTFVGVVGLETADSFAGASLIAFDARVAQAALGTPGTWSSLSIAADPGVSQEELRTRVATVLPKGFEALTQKQTAADSAKALKKGLSVFNTVLLVFAGVALFVGAFLIFNTFSMLVAQRVRELALLRALGASRGQVTGSVLVEALVVGVLASVAGFGLGIGLAVGLRALLGALGIDLPKGPTVVELRTFLVALAVGAGVTAVAALIPARRAARVAPVQAMRDSGPAEERSLGRRSVVGALLLAAGVLALLMGLNGSGGLQVVGLGAVLAFLGVATLSPLIARPAVGLLGLPFLRLGAPSRLGRGNALRSPRRTAATASALMIGLALVATVSTFGQSTKTSLSAYVARSVGADFVLSSQNFQGFSLEVPKALRARPELAQVAAFRAGRARVAGDRVELQGVEAGPLEATLKIKTLHGDLTSIDRGELAVSEPVAKARHLSVGQVVEMVWSRTGSHRVRIGAIYAQSLFGGNYLVGAATYDANVTEPLVAIVAVTAKPNVTADQARAAVDAAVAPFPNVKVSDQVQLVRDQKKQIDGLLNVVTGLLVFSVLIAVLGIVNTLALSVVERTRELGLLRAVGLQRRQLRRMIRVESVLIAVFGAVLGIGVGLAFGWALVQALKDQGIDQFAVPWARLLWVLVAAGVAGVVAAALPARRAARLDILEAVAAT
jgi:putative ABC transport system permease protein